MAKSQHTLPAVFENWLKRRRWSLHPHQWAMLEASADERDCLLVAPTGSGKTLSGFLPSLIDLHQSPREGLHTLYLSPLKALANDIARNLMMPVEEMKLGIRVETRTGDTSSHARARQRKTPPQIMLTTPESLALLLSYEQSAELFASLQTIVIDEIHAFAGTKRGDQTALLLSRLYTLAPDARRVGLSATIADPKAIANWLKRPKDSAEIIVAEDRTPPRIEMLKTARALPLAGRFPAHAMPEIYARIRQEKASIVFVNTRSQAEMLFQALWDMNEQGLPIALHHGSLTKEQRMRVENAMAAGEIRAVIATASLDLGIDWGDIGLVIQIGAPKGVSRLIQRIGRSNHRFDQASKALLVPCNCFEAIECEAAMRAIAEKELEPTKLPERGALDVLAQHIMNCACAGGFEPEALYREIITAAPYAKVTYGMFERCVAYVTDGGYVLRRYENHARLVQEHERLVPASPRVVQRHRMNIGTIVEAEKLKVMRISRRAQGKRQRIGGTYLGEVEEQLVTGMQPGDTFLFAGQIWRFERVRDMTVEVTPSSSRHIKIPVFAGGKMPLSTFLAERVRQLVAAPDALEHAPSQVERWLRAQARASLLPPQEGLLAECFSREDVHYLILYPFEGRPAHHSLGFLLTQRMEKLGLLPLGFTVSDYALAVWGAKPVPEQVIRELLSPGLLELGFEEWLMRSHMMKRGFRTIAVIAGLIERRLPGNRRSGRQVTFSTDLIFDVLRKYEPEHVLLSATREDVMRELADLPRVEALLARVQGHISVRRLPCISPLAVPIVAELLTEHVSGGVEAALAAMGGIQTVSATLMEEAGV